MTTHDLALDVVTRVGTPRDAWEITAQLEVMGLRDADARTGYGHRDLFDLGRAIYDLCRTGALACPLEPDDPPKKPTSFFTHYAKGSVFAIPMLLQAAAILTWGYGLWGGRDVDVRTGTAIALGFVGSYVLTGGFVQAITRRGLFYVYQQESGLARWVVLRGWWLGARIVLGLIVPALAFNALYGLLPWDLFLVATLYYASLSLLWLNWSMVYVAGQRYWIAIVTAAALGVVVMLARYRGWNIIAANTAGLAVAAVLSFVMGVQALGGFGRLAPHNPPRITVLVYSTSRWFLYGLLYNAFVFADRIVAWTARTGREDLPPYSFWLSPRYELGMDLALVVVMILSGAVEAAVQTFSERLVPVEKSLASDERERFSAWFTAFYRRRLALIVVAAIVAIAGARACVTLVSHLPDQDIRTGMTSASAMTAFWLGAIGYALLMPAMQNTLLLLTLSRVELAVRAVAIALAANLTVGFVCSRAIFYADAAAGLVAGSAVLFVITWLDVRRVGARLDYHYFAAF
jgi:hypothetical protein